MIRFSEIEGTPDKNILEEIKEFSVLIFDKIDSTKFEKRLSESKDLLTNLAVEKDKIVGFKIGYQIAPKKFYSWIGGVDKSYRKSGIARELMLRQHDWCIKNEYKIVQTKTKNSFKQMLILNIKNGFDIVAVYRNSRNELKIVLEKDLTNS